MEAFEVYYNFNEIEDAIDSEEYNDIDALFSQLEVVKPPSDMVERIMNAVAQLPLPAERADESEENTLHIDTQLLRVI